MLNLSKTKYLWLTVSGILVIPSLVLLFVWGLRPSIDFTGGTLLEVAFTSARPDASEARTVVQEALTAPAVDGQSAGSMEVTLQTLGDNAFLLRTGFMSNDQRNAVLSALGQQYGEVREQSFETIGPVVGRELRQKSYTSMALVLVFIVLYIAWAFRKVSSSDISSWKMGLAAIVALVHDILLVVGVFVVLGHYYHVEVGTLFVTALLTILGFSVHDTIVVFDRLRERLRQGGSQTFAEKVNDSVNSTLARSINTSMTALFMLVALYLFGGQSIHHFALALIVGIISGTYSSIFVASPLLLVWAKNK